MKESRIDYAAQAQELAFRAWWLDTHDKGPVPPRPRRWDSSNIWRFSGVASLLRHFGIERHLDACRGNPRKCRASARRKRSLSQHIERDKDECRAAVQTLEWLDRRENELDAALAALFKQKRKTPWLSSLVHPLKAARHELERARQLATRRLGGAPPQSPPPGLEWPQEWFSLILWQDAEERQVALGEQLSALHQAGVTWGVIAELLGCACDDKQKTRDRVRCLVRRWQCRKKR